MLISVIIPTHNHGQYIKEAIDSAINQTYKQQQIVVIDDKSTDNTRSVLDPYIEAGQIEYIYNDGRSGPAATRNRGLAVAKGELIAFLDADDVWIPEKLEKQVKLFTNPNIGLVYSDIKFGGEDFQHEKLSDMGNKLNRGKIFEKLVKDNFISTSTVVMRKSLLDKIGNFNENFFPGEDYEMWLKASILSEIDFSPEALSMYRLHEDQHARGSYKTYKGLRRMFKSLLREPSLNKEEVKMIRFQYYKTTAKMFYSFLFRRGR